MSLATQVAPAHLTEEVLAAVTHGVWAPRDILTAVADTHADRADVVATLWDLVADGVLTYDGHTGYPVFRPAEN